MLQVSELIKNYGRKQVLRATSFDVKCGEVVALLGRNGAGKSTSMKILVGLLEPDSGSVQIDHQSPKRAVNAGLVGYCPQDVALYPTLSVEQNLQFFASIFGIAEIAEERLSEVADNLGLGELLRVKVGTLSGGEKRRVHLAATLVSSAPLLLLDEPSAGVDVESREMLIESIRKEARGGRAVLLCSHDLAEVERLADRVIILHKGLVKVCGTLAEISAPLGDLVSIEFESPTSRDTAHSLFANEGPRSRGPAGLDIYVSDTVGIDTLTSSCAAAELPIRRLEYIPSGLEAAFLRLTSESQAL